MADTTHLKALLVELRGELKDLNAFRTRLDRSEREYAAVAIRLMEALAAGDIDGFRTAQSTMAALMPDVERLRAEAPERMDQASDWWHRLEVGCARGVADRNAEQLAALGEPGGG